MLLLGVPLVQAVPVVLLVALPGVVLYVLHWQVALGRVGRWFAGAVWAFTLVDEVWGLLLFRALDAPTPGQIRLLYWSYLLGLGLILLALGELGWHWQRRRARARRNVHHRALRPASSARNMAG